MSTVLPSDFDRLAAFGVRPDNIQVWMLQVNARIKHSHGHAATVEIGVSRDEGVELNFCRYVVQSGAVHQRIELNEVEVGLTTLKVAELVWRRAKPESRGRDERFGLYAK